MKLRKVSAAILFATALLMMTAIPLPSRALKGPRTEDLILYYYETVDSAYAALKAGEIDMVGYEITADLFTDASQDANIVVGQVADSGFYEFDINNNGTILTFPDWISPTNYVEMRQAIAWLTDKDFIVSEITGGFTERIDQMIAAPYYGWANASMSYPNYPYEYDPSAAAAVLDTKFPEGSTSNPYYDPGFPGSAEFIRTYPTGHSKAGSDLDPLEVVVRTDDFRRFEAGRLLYGNLRKHGVPVNPFEGPSSDTYDKVMGQFDYHIYTGGWSVGRFPPLTLYALYHSRFTYAYGPNYVTGNGTYPELDALLEDCNFALSYSEAVTATKLATGKMTELAVNVPLWSSLSYWAWNKHLIGVVNMLGAGPENGYTFLNAYRDDTPSGGPIRYGPKTPPNALNIVYSQWYYDYQNLDRMNLYGGVDVPAYDLSIDQPGFVENWETGIWYDSVAAENKTVLTMKFRPDAYFVEPVTGNQKSNVNSSHYFFNIWLDYNVDPSGWFISDVAEVHHVDMVNTTTIKTYFDTLSYWNTYYASGIFRPMDTWAQHTELITKTSESIAWSGTGTVGLTNDPCWIESIDVDGTPLTHGTDWNIVRGDLEILTSQTGTLNVDYWSPNDPRGFTPGNLAWQTILEGAGAFYAVNFDQVGGTLSLKRSPFYYMETPPLGEIDYVRKPNGAYRVDIFDLVIAAGADGSQGTSVPSTNWFAGADTTPEGGVVDIFDQVTVTGHWLEEWDVPP